MMPPCFDVIVIQPVRLRRPPLVQPPAADRPFLKFHAPEDHRAQGEAEQELLNREWIGVKQAVEERYVNRQQLQQERRDDSAKQQWIAENVQLEH